MDGMKLSGDVVKIRLKEHERLLGMREGFTLPVENIESVSTAKVSCKYPGWAASAPGTAWCSTTGRTATRSSP